MWDLPRPGLEPVSPALARRLSTTAPQGKTHHFLFIQCKVSLLRSRNETNSSLYFPTSPKSHNKCLSQHVCQSKYWHFTGFLEGKYLHHIKAWVVLTNSSSHHIVLGAARCSESWKTALRLKLWNWQGRKRENAMGVMKTKDRQSPRSLSGEHSKKENETNTQRWEVTKWLNRLKIIEQ